MTTKLSIADGYSVLVARRAASDRVPPTGGETEVRIRAVLDSLVHERQELKRADVDRQALEANRLALIYWQQALAARRAPRVEPALREA